MEHTAEKAAASSSTPAVASDIMTVPVISFAPDASVRDAARLLLEKRISAVPVVDNSGNLIGMVSEGDLLGRSEQDRLAGRDWWLAMLAQEGQPASGFTPEQLARPVKEVMHVPVITVAADVPIPVVADTLRTHRVKRLPVLRDGRMVGIVSRADLLRAMAAIPVPVHKPAAAASGLVRLIMSPVGSGKPAEGTAAHPAPLTSASQAPVPATARAFRDLVRASKQAVIDERQRAAREADLARRRQVKSMLQAHLDAEMWETLLDHARAAAAHGEKEFQLLRFPSDLCSDGGRKIDVAEAGWEGTLRGEAADLYSRWERELKPAGFGLSARVLEYPRASRAISGCSSPGENEAEPQVIWRCC